jgi:hypothetical protein
MTHSAQKVQVSLRNTLREIREEVKPRLERLELNLNAHRGHGADTEAPGAMTTILEKASAIVEQSTAPLIAASDLEQLLKRHASGKQ